MSSQEQSGGFGSTNYQISIQSGLSYKDVRDIAQELYDQNMEKFAQVANTVGHERAEKIRTEIMEALSKQIDSKLETFKMPDRQVALLEAQKAYVLSGDDELKDMVVRMVTNLSKEDARNLRSIVIGEAIKTVSTLTPRQIQILATVYIIRYVHFTGASSVESLADWFEKSLLGRVSNFDASVGDLRHIEYARCGKVSLMGLPIVEHIRTAYRGLFQRGSKAEELVPRFIPDPFPDKGTMPCLNDEALIQIAALDDRVVDQKAEMFNWTENQKVKAKEILNENMIDNAIVSGMLESSHPRLAELVGHWTKSGISQFELTSVGIAIAHSYVGSTMELSDLNVWL